ncbi:hypothetical protein D3C74_264320 [compost metagenome]
MRTNFESIKKWMGSYPPHPCPLVVTVSDCGCFESFESSVTGTKATTSKQQTIAKLRIGLMLYMHLTCQIIKCYLFYAI